MFSARSPGRRVDISLQAELERIDDALGYYRHLSNVRAFVDSQNSRPVTLATAAQAIGISQSQLSRLFQEKVGISFRSWLTRRHIHAAMELLRQRQMSAYEAARLSGFASYRSFARTFKEVAGITPSAYRKLVEEELSTHDHE